MKIWAYVALATLIIAAVGTAFRATYKAGYNTRDVEIRNGAIAAQNAAIEKGVQDWIRTQELAEPVIVTEERIVEKVRVIEKEIPKIVKEIVTVTPQCRDLGADYAELLNQQVRASNSHQVEDTDATTDLVE